MNAKLANVLLIAKYIKTSPKGKKYLYTEWQSQAGKRLLTSTEALSLDPVLVMGKTYREIEISIIQGKSGEKYWTLFAFQAANE